MEALKAMGDERRKGPFLLFFLLSLFLFFIKIKALMALPPYAESHQDRLENLYKKQVFFNDQNQPMVSVGLTEHQEEVWLKIDGGVEIFLSGSSHSSIKWQQPSLWKITLNPKHKSKAAKIEYCVILDQVTDDQREQKQILEKKLNESLKILEAGAVVGITGKLLDTKQNLISKCGFIDDSEARKVADLLGEKLDRHLELITELVEYPKGHIIAIEQGSGIELTSEDLIWFSPIQGVISLENLKAEQKTPISQSSLQKSNIARSYEGDIYVAIGSDGLLLTVNDIKAEALLEGVVPSESYVTAPLEALKAQAIAARGHLMSKAGARHRADPFLFCAQVHCQAYTGIEKKHDITDQAVRETQGLLLFDQEQKLVDSVYSSTCGGHTESYHLMWGGKIKKALLGKKDQWHLDKVNKDQNQSTQIQAQSQSDQTINQFSLDQSMTVDELKRFVTQPSTQAFCQHPAHTYRWKERVSGKVISKNINRKASIGAIYGIEVLKRGVSGRVIDVKYHGQKGSYMVRGSYLNRTLMGNLKSGLWLLKAQYGKQAPQSFMTDTYDSQQVKKQEPSFWIFEGAGYGHGVGMCQHGAIEMSKQGISHEQILEHYYGGAKVIKIW